MVMRPEDPTKTVLGGKIGFEVVVSGQIGTTDYPTTYGTVLKITAYYSFYVCINSGGGEFWIKPTTGGEWRHFTETT